MSEKVTVQLPNLVASFLAEPFAVNENYAAASQISREWLGEKCGLSESDKRILQKGEFAYFCALNTPDCGLDKFRDFCVWGNWVFPFDDLFDNGELKDDLKGALAVMDNLLESMDGTAEPKTKFVATHQDVWIRFKGKATEGNRRRFFRAIVDYSDDVLHQVKDCAIEWIQKPEDLINLRRNSIGVKPLYAFVEYCNSIELPDYVFQHDIIKEIERLGINWVLIQNDLISYPKDEAEGVNHNLISSFRRQGMGPQEAYDKLGSWLEGIYERFDKAEAQLPKWGEKVDEEVLRYIEGIKNCVKANLHWSFRMDCYFGARKSEVQRTGRLEVLKTPSYLVGR